MVFENQLSALFFQMPLVCPSHLCDGQTEVCSLRLKTLLLKKFFRSDTFQISFPKTSTAPKMSEKNLAVIRKTC